MKSLSQIRKKCNTLKGQLRKKQVVENFGDKEIRKLEDFIGDIYSYDYSDRMEIIGTTNDFADFCGNYTSK